MHQSGRESEGGVNYLAPAPSPLRRQESSANDLHKNWREDLMLVLRNYCAETLAIVHFPRPATVMATLPVTSSLAQTHPYIIYLLLL